MTKYIVTAYDVSKGIFFSNWDILSTEIALDLYKRHLELGRIHVRIGKQLEVVEKTITTYEVIND